MSTHERPGGGDDRARREELEALQVELREAKQALALTGSAEPPELAALRDAAARAGERRAAALTHKQALEAERERLEEQAERLKARIEEERVLARGAAHRYTNDDWANVRTRSGLDSTWVAQLGVYVGIGLFAAVMLIGDCTRPGNNQWERLKHSPPRSAPSSSKPAPP